jgi:predicted dehydrogenase
VKPVRWGILSTAKIGLLKVIPAMQRTKGCEIVGIASRDLNKAKEAASSLGIPKAFGSYEDLLADAEIEAIYNPLPNHLHVPLSIAAARAGKHVLCEKPIALNAAEASTLIDARESAGVLIQEAFMVRYHPQWLRVRELVRSGEIGRLRSIQGSFSYNNRDPRNIRNIAEIGGGGLYDIGCYPITGSRFLFEGEPTRVVSLIERDPDWGIDRLTSAILDFPGGHATFTCSTQLTPYQRMQVFGTEGRIEIEIPFNAPPDRPCRLFLDDGSRLGNAGLRVEELPVTDQYAAQGEVFSKAIRTGEPLEFPIENAVQGMRIIDAVFRSAVSGKWETP